jgi:two-component system sensor histidine kinase DesK
MNIIKRIFQQPWLPARVGKAPYLWVFSLSFLLWKYAYVAPSKLEVICLVATVIAYVPLYFGSFWATQGRLMLFVAASCLFGMAWAPFNFGASCFFVFAAGMCGALQPARKAYAAVAVTMLLAVLMALTIDTLPLTFLLPSVAVGIPVGIATIMDVNLRRSRDQLLRKQEEVEHMATIAERERISRDLHDLLGHTLSLITLKAELAGKLLGRDEAACRQEIGDIERSARNALSEVRAAVTGYRQSGFAHELASARASLASAGITLQAQVQPFSMPPAAENVLSLALREAVTNILRHAKATACDVELACRDGQIHFRIADNGAELAGIAHGNGLAGMRERVSAIGGKLDIVAGRGLALNMMLPVGVC